MVRVGIAIYGQMPEPDSRIDSAMLRPAMRVHSAVAAIRDVQASVGVSYGHTHHTTRPTRLALVPIGYADGVPRLASSRATVSINGSRHPIVGTISMDQCVVDIGDSAVTVGDEVVLWGDPSRGEPSLQEWAEACNTIPYELMTRIGGRLTRTDLAYTTATASATHANHPRRTPIRETECSSASPKRSRTTSTESRLPRTASPN